MAYVVSLPWREHRVPALRYADITHFIAIVLSLPVLFARPI